MCLLTPPHQAQAVFVPKKILGSSLVGKTVVNTVEVLLTVVCVMNDSFVEVTHWFFSERVMVDILLTPATSTSFPFHPHESCAE